MPDARLECVRKLADAVLYAGHRGRQRRWSFGHLYPRGYSVWSPGTTQFAQQVQCLVEGDDDVRVTVCVRFLQAVETTRHRGPCRVAWRAAVEREVCGPEASVSALSAAPQRQTFRYPGVEGLIAVWAQRLGADCHRLTVRVENLSPFNPTQPWDEDEAALHSLAAAHTVISVDGGKLVSLIDPPHARRDAAAHCVNRGCFPILVGDPVARDTLLAAPTILHDFPDPDDGARRR